MSIIDYGQPTIVFWIVLQNPLFIVSNEFAEID